MVDCPSAINGIIGWSLLKALKAVTSIYYLTMKFPIAERAEEVWGSQYDLKERYNKSPKLAEIERWLPQRMEVGKAAGSSANLR